RPRRAAAVDLHLRTGGASRVEAADRDAVAYPPRGEPAFAVAHGTGEVEEVAVARQRGDVALRAVGGEAIEDDVRVVMQAVPGDQHLAVTGIGARRVGLAAQATVGCH